MSIILTASWIFSPPDRFVVFDPLSTACCLTVQEV
jgi:hypothetical protein